MMGHVAVFEPRALWSGLAVDVAVVPRPPPNCPTIMIEVGTVFAGLPAGVVGVNVRLFVRLIVRLCPVGTVILTGDQPAGVVSVAAGAFGFNAAHVAVEPTTAVPQL
jgi:hypothetical protein